MQKLILLVVALLLTTYTYAQKGLEVGIQFTPGTSWIMNDEDFAEDDDLNFKASFGFNTGLALGYNFTDGIGLQSGIIYSKTKQNYINANSAASKAEQDLYSRTLSYIRVPVLFKFNGDISSSASAYFRIGPHFDFLSNAQYEYQDIESTTLDNLFDLSFKENMNPYTSASGTTYKVYKKVVVGLTLEMGGIIRINESMGIIMLLHLEGSLTNTEDVDSYRFYPSTAANERGTAFNVMAGLTIGYNYIIDFSK